MLFYIYKERLRFRGAFGGRTMNSRTLDFVTKLLKNTMKLDMHYFVEPYNDLSAFDHFLRDSLEGSDLLYKVIHDFIKDLDHNSFHIMTDCYGLHYVLFYPYLDKKDLITLGPYFNVDIDETYWHGIMERHKLTLSNIQHLKSFMYSIPVINNNLHIISTISDIINYINPETNPFTVHYHDFSDTAKTGLLFQPKKDFEAYAKKVEERYNIEKELMSHITAGNGRAALEAAKKFISSPFEPRLQNSLREQKSLLITANTAFRKAVEPNEIHPIYLHEITSKFVNLIENATSIVAIDQLYEKMIREYCFLVRNKSTKQYSPIVRKTLHFIEFNLDSKINLNQLADSYGVSVPYLSSQFKKEVGTTIIKYVNEKRVEMAVKLLNTSPLSIQDIASYVGIYDYNYFTKVFKKEIGVSPSDYRKHLYQGDKMDLI